MIGAVTLRRQHATIPTTGQRGGQRSLPLRAARSVTFGHERFSAPLRTSCALSHASPRDQPGHRLCALSTLSSRINAWHQSSSVRAHGSRDLRPPASVGAVWADCCVCQRRTVQQHLCTDEDESWRRKRPVPVPVPVRCRCVCVTHTPVSRHADAAGTCGGAKPRASAMPTLPLVPCAAAARGRAHASP